MNPGDLCSREGHLLAPDEQFNGKKMRREKEGRTPSGGGTGKALNLPRKRLQNAFQVFASARRPRLEKESYNLLTQAEESREGAGFYQCNGKNKESSTTEDEEIESGANFNGEGDRPGRGEAQRERGGGVRKIRMFRGRFRRGQWLLALAS